MRGRECAGQSLWNSKGRRVASGFTLVEVLVALALLGICLIPVVKMLPASLAIGRKVTRQTALAFLAQQQMETAIAQVEYDFQPAQ